MMLSASMMQGYELKRKKNETHIVAHPRFVFLAWRLIEYDDAPQSNHVFGVPRKVIKIASRMSLSVKRMLQYGKRAGVLYL